MKIGIFDSGFGGLSIMRAVVAHLPQYDYAYLGDTARTPYGTRSADTVYDFTLQAVEFLFAQDCQLVIFACNTASAEALAKIQREVLPEKYPDRRVLGVIIPAAEEATKKTQNQKIGVLATGGTVKSNAFKDEITKILPDAEVIQQACPIFVPLVETREQDESIIAAYAQRYTQLLADAGVDTVILGCTHYEFLQEHIQKALGDNVQIVAEGAVVARKLEKYLHEHQEITSQITQNANREFYTTDLSDRFVTNGRIFYGQDLTATAVKID